MTDVGRGSERERERGKSGRSAQSQYYNDGKSGVESQQINKQLEHDGDSVCWPLDMLQTLIERSLRTHVSEVYDKLTTRQAGGGKAGRLEGSASHAH